MNWINTNTFSHQNYFPVRQYAANFPSPTDGDTAINTLPIWSFFQADQHQITDQINSDSSVHSIAGYAVKITIDAYLTITRLWHAGGLYPPDLGPIQKTIFFNRSLITDGAIN